MVFGDSLHWLWNPIGEPLNGAVPPSATSEGEMMIRRAMAMATIGMRGVMFVSLKRAGTQSK